MMTIMHEQASRLRILKESISDDELLAILNNVYDGFQRYGCMDDDVTADENLKLMRSFCKHLAESGTYKRIIRPRIITHKFFSVMSSFLWNILKHANKIKAIDHEKTNFLWSAFHAMAALYTSSLRLDDIEQKKTNRLILEAFYSDEFLGYIKETMESLLSDYHPNDHIKYRISSYVLQNVYMLGEVSDSRIKLFLLTPIMNSVGSKLYADLYVKGTDGPVELLLSDCPRLIQHLFNEYEQNISESICAPLLKNADSIFESCRSGILRDDKNKDAKKYFSNYLHLLNRCLMVESVRKIFIEYGSSLVINLFTVIEMHTITDTKRKTCKIEDADLVAIALTMMYNLMFDSTIRIVIAQKIEKSSIFLLANIEEESISNEDKRKDGDIHKHIQFPARSLIALTIEDIDKLDKVEDVTGDYISYLSKAIRNEPHAYEGVHAGTILSDVKTIAQNREVKAQLVKQKALPLLTKCASDPKFDVDRIQQPALEAIWTVSFNGKASDLWRNDEKFIQKLKELVKSDRTEQQDVADGILWRLINEAQFIAEQSTDQRTLVLSRKNIEDIEDNENKVWVQVKSSHGYITTRLQDSLTEQEQNNIVESRPESAAPKKKTDTSYKYDLMISYSHDDGGICDILYQCLSKMNKYSIWFDKNNLHGSLMERMAEAIEESHIVLICMSKNYKMSLACQSEGEYAYTRKRAMIFLKVEPKYKPNGWLGLLLRQNLYIDVSKTNFTTVFKSLTEQISRTRKETFDDTLTNGIVTADIERVVADILAQVKAETAPGITGTVPSPIIEPVIGRLNSTLTPASIAPSPSTVLTSSQQTPRRNSYSKETVYTEIVPLPTCKRNGANTKYPVLSFLNTPATTARRSSITSEHLPSINSSQASSKSNTPVPSPYEKYIGSPDNQFIVGYERCTAEELVELYPSDFEYTSESDDDDFNNNKIRKQSISSISDDDYFIADIVPTNSAQRLEATTSKETESSLPKTKGGCQTKSIDNWTQQDVYEFFKQHQLYSMYPLFKEVNGKRLLEIYQLSKPTSSEALEALKKKLNTSSTINIPLHDFERFQCEFRKLLPPSTENDQLFCTVM